MFYSIVVVVLIASIFALIFFIVFVLNVPPALMTKFCLWD